MKRILNGVTPTLVMVSWIVLTAPELIRRICLQCLFVLGHFAKELFEPPLKTVDGFIKYEWFPIVSWDHPHGYLSQAVILIAIAINLSIVALMIYGFITGVMKSITWFLLKLLPHLF